MNQFLKKFLSLACIAYLTGCVSLSPYKVAVLQGNIIEDKDLEKLKSGLTKDQVKYLLGTPLANSPLNKDRWDYYYSIRVGETAFVDKKLTLIFSQNELLDSWNLVDNLPNENN